MDLGGGPHPSTSSTDNAAPAEDTLGGQPDESGAADASLVQGVQSAAATARKLAGGAVKRVLRQRQSASNRRGGSRAYVEDNDDHDASEGDSADSASVRNPSLPSLLYCLVLNPCFLAWLCLWYTGRGLRQPTSPTFVAQVQPRVLVGARPPVDRPAQPAPTFGNALQPAPPRCQPKSGSWRRPIHPSRVSSLVRESWS